jgi:RNA polymerase sigma-70 factor (ECF subfamily)
MKKEYSEERGRVNAAHSRRPSRGQENERSDHQTLSDSDLVEASKKGDDLAFKALMERHARSVFNFTRQYVKTEDDIEDVVQDAFFKVWRHIKRFKKGAAFKPWLFTIARNTALDHIKKRRAAVFSTLDDAENDLTFADTIEDKEPLATELFERAELAAELDESMKDMHPDHRAVMIMHYREELTFDEIAGIMGKPMNTVKSWHHRAVMKIRGLLAHRKP